MGARYYDPALGRFISADSVVPDPGNAQAFDLRLRLQQPDLERGSERQRTGRRGRPQRDWGERHGDGDRGVDWGRVQRGGVPDQEPAPVDHRLGDAGLRGRLRDGVSAWRWGWVPAGERRRLLPSSPLSPLSPKAAEILGWALTIEGLIRNSTQDATVEMDDPSECFSNIADTGGGANPGLPDLQARARAGVEVIRGAEVHAGSLTAQARSSAARTAPTGSATPTRRSSC